MSLADLSVPQLEALQLRCPITAEILDVATRATIEESPAIRAMADFVVVNDLAASTTIATTAATNTLPLVGRAQQLFISLVPIRWMAPQHTRPH